MLINDLSYCEVVEENVVGGFGFSKNISLNTDVDQDFDVNIDVDINKDVDITADSVVNADGTFAQLTFDSTVVGENQFNEVDVSVFTSAGLSEIAGTITTGVSY